MLVSCAWCQKEMGWKEGEGVTHGICEDCYEKEIQKMGRRPKVTDVVDANDLPAGGATGQDEAPPKADMEVPRRRARKSRVAGDMNGLLEEFKRKKAALIDRYMKKIARAMAE